MIGGDQSCFAANFSLFAISRRSEPLYIAVVIDRVENFEEQRCRHGCATQIGNTGGRKISYPNSHSVIFIITNTPGIFSSIACSCFPCDLGHMFCGLPVDREVWPVDP